MSIADITGTTLHLVFNYREKNAVDLTAGTDHPVPPTASQLLQTPLSTLFDQFWNVTPDSDGKTQRDHAVEQVIKELKAKGADQINGGFPATGTLQGSDGTGFFLIDGSEVRGNLFLTYTLPGAHFTFHIGPTAWRLSFDLALKLLINVSDQPGPLEARGLSTIENAKVSPDNFLATVAEFVVDTFIPSPNSLLTNVGNSIDGSKNLPVNQFNTSLAQLTPVFQSALTHGFGLLRAVVDTTGVTLRLIHSVSGGPEVIDRNTLPSLHFQALAVSQSQIRAGGQLVATGSGFTLANATSLHLSWGFGGSGGSDIEVTPPNGPTQNFHVPGNDTGFIVSGLVPDATYRVRVRVCDDLTCTDFSAPLTVKTGSTDQIDLSLQSATETIDVGHTKLRLDGTFSSVVDIPLATTPGPCILHATIRDETAAASLQVIATNQAAHPLLSVLDSVTGKASSTQVAGVIEEEKVTVRGEDFPPGLVELHVETGKLLGTATASPAGLFTTSFTWPAGVTGSHEIVASELVAGIRATQASAPVLVQPLPR